MFDKDKFMDIDKDGDVDLYDYLIIHSIVSSNDDNDNNYQKNSYDDDDDEFDDDEFSDDDDDDNYEKERFDYIVEMPDKLYEAIEKGYITESDLEYEISSWSSDCGSIGEDCDSISISGSTVEVLDCEEDLYDYLSSYLYSKLESYGEELLEEHSDDELSDDSESGDHESEMYYDYKGSLPDSVREVIDKGYITPRDLAFKIASWGSKDGKICEDCSSILIGSDWIEVCECTKSLYDYLEDNFYNELEKYGNKLLTIHADKSSKIESDDAKKGSFKSDEEESSKDLSKSDSRGIPTIVVKEKSTEECATKEVADSKEDSKFTSRLEGLLDYDDSTFGFLDTDKREPMGHVLVKRSTDKASSKDLDTESKTETKDSKDDHFEKLPKVSMWKYAWYTKENAYFEFEKALIDNFPCLSEDFDEHSDETVSQMLSHMCYFNPDWAVDCMWWLWHTFKADEIRALKYDVEYSLYILCVETVSMLMSDCKSFKKSEDENRLKHCKIIFNYLNNEDMLDSMFFDKPKWIIHKTDPLWSYMILFISHGDFDRAIRGYRRYLVSQAGRYNNKDLYELFGSIIALSSDYVDYIPRSFYNFVIEEISKLGKYTQTLMTNARKYMLEHVR